MVDALCHGRDGVAAAREWYHAAMRLSGVVATAILAGGTAMGQASVTRLFDLQGALTTLSERDDANAEPGDAAVRLVALIGKLVDVLRQLGQLCRFSEKLVACLSDRCR